MDARLAATAAQRLLGAEGMVARDMPRGGNNRLFLLSGSGGRRAVAKFYPRLRADGQSRLLTEFNALTALTEAGCGPVPRPLAADQTLSLGIYEYIDGAALGKRRPTADELDAMLRFLEGLAHWSARGGSALLGPACEACPSPLAAFANTEARCAALLGVKPQDDLAQAMRTFLLRSWEPAYRKLRDRAAAALTQEGVRLDAHVPLTMSPADFGTHNALTLPGGGLAFLDFEYFGWDDPVKMIADFCFHPAMQLAADERDGIFSRLSPLYADAALERRYRLLSPLYGLRWCLIMLNPFLRQPRPGDGNAREAVAARLDNAVALCNEVLRTGPQP